MQRSAAALAMQKARRAALDRRNYWERVKDSRATRAIQKASRTIKGMRDTYALGAASQLFKLASEELGPSIAAFLGEFCRLPLQKFAALEPCGAFGDRPRAEAIAAALSSLSFSEDLACLLTPFLVDTIVRTAPMPKHRHREAPLSPAVRKSKFYGACVLNHRVSLHAIDATSPRWRGVVFSHCSN